MKRNLTPIWLLAILFIAPNFLNAQTFSDDFEGYNVGDYIGANSSNWTTWSGTTGGAEDAKVVDDKASSGTKSIFFKGTANGGPQDVVLPFGGLHETGTFEYAMKMYIPLGKGAYFNFQGAQQIGTLWSLDCFLNNDGTMSINVPASGNVGMINFPADIWFELKFEVNLNTNTWKLFKDGTLALEFQSATNVVASIDLFPTDGDSEFWVDDVSYQYTPYVVSGTNASAYYIDMNTGLAGQDRGVTGTIKNLGTNAITSFDVAFDYNGSTLNETVSGVNIPSLGEHEVSFNRMTTLAAGNKTISLTVSNVNGNGGDDNAADDTKSLNINPVVPAVGKVVVGEEGTGTWCQWCPRGAVAMDKMAADFDGYFAGIAVHNGDPMAFDAYDQGMGTKISGYPSALVDRGPDIDPGVIDGDFIQRITETPDAVLKNGASLDDDTTSIAISVTTTFNQNITGDWRLVCVLTEDGIQRDSTGYAQSNAYANNSNGPMGGYESLPSKVPASQMVYDHVARAISPSFEGTANTFGASVNSGADVTKVFYFKKGGLWNLSKMHVVAMLIEPSGRVNNASYSTLDAALTNGFATGESVTGVEIPAQPDDAFALFPNPTNQTAIVKSVEQVSEIIVTDITGKVVYRDNQAWEGFYQISKDKTGTGVFLILLFGEEKQILNTQKLVVY